MVEFLTEWYAAWVRALFFPLVRAFEQGAVVLEGCGCFSCPPGICDTGCPWCNDDLAYDVELTEQHLIDARKYLEGQSYTARLAHALDKVFVKYEGPDEPLGFELEDYNVGFNRGMAAGANVRTGSEDD